MPRKDPHTGVEVLTMPEFFEKMGAPHGRTAAEEMDSFMQEFEEHKAQDDEAFRQPANVLDVINSVIREENRHGTQENEWYKEWIARGNNPYKGYESYVLQPAVDLVLEVIEAVQEYGPFGGGTKTRIRAKVQLDNGENKIFDLKSEDWPGSWDEGPWSEVEISWEDAEEHIKARATTSHNEQNSQSHTQPPPTTT